MSLLVPQRAVRTRPVPMATFVIPLSTFANLSTPTPAWMIHTVLLDKDALCQPVFVRRLHLIPVPRILTALGTESATRSSGSVLPVRLNVSAMINAPRVRFAMPVAAVPFLLPCAGPTTNAPPDRPAQLAVAGPTAQLAATISDSAPEAMFATHLSMFVNHQPLAIAGSTRTACLDSTALLQTNVQRWLLLSA